MLLMVQDLTNPMLATIPHVLLAAHIGTIKGVECAMRLSFIQQPRWKMKNDTPVCMNAETGWSI